MAASSSHAHDEAVCLRLGCNDPNASAVEPSGETDSAPKAIALLSKACHGRKRAAARVVARDFKAELTSADARLGVMTLCELASRVVFQVGRSSKEATYIDGVFSGPGSGVLKDLLAKELASRAKERELLQQFVDQNELCAVRLDWAAGRYKGRLGPQSTRFVLHYVGGKDLVLHDKGFLPQPVMPGMGVIIDYAPLASGQRFASLYVPLRASELR